MANSPWGKVQYSHPYAPGFRMVSTAGHGGLMLTLQFSADHLSQEAQKRGENWGGYLCYEEDCDYAIPLWELPEYWSSVFSHFEERGGEVAIRKSLLKTLSRWHPDYLTALGVEPEAKAYANYLEWEQDQEMRKRKDPDLIVGAVGAWNAKIPEGAVGVTTADGKFHLVKAESYVHREGRTIIRLLSECEPFQVEETP